MEWPFRRFIKAFDSYQRRTLCDEWRQRKTAHIAALYANTNLDSEENDRGSVIDKLEKSYDKLIATLWSGEVDEETKAEEDAWESPFMRAGRNALQSVQPPSLPGERRIAALPA